MSSRIQDPRTLANACQYDNYNLFRTMFRVWVSGQTKPTKLEYRYLRAHCPGGVLEGGTPALSTVPIGTGELLDELEDERAAEQAAELEKIIARKALAYASRLASSGTLETPGVSRARVASTQGVIQDIIRTAAPDQEILVAKSIFSPDIADEDVAPLVPQTTMNWKRIGTFAAGGLAAGGGLFLAYRMLRKKPKGKKRRKKN